MRYFIDHKDRSTEYKYVCQFTTGDIFEAIETATKVARQLNDEYKESYEANFDESWSEARKKAFYKANAWSIRVKDDDGKTILLIKDNM